MKPMMMLMVCATLSACATARPVPMPAPPPSGVTPVALGELRGSADVLIFPDIDVPSAYDGAVAYARQCLPTARRVDGPNGFALYGGDAAPLLTVTVASVSQSSALGVGGTGFTPALKEALAATVQGRPTCA